MLEEEPVEQPAAVDAPAIVVVQTLAEGRGFPAHVPDGDKPLPPAGIPIVSIVRLVALPCCELLSWPLAMLQWLLGPPKKPAAG